MLGPAFHYQIFESIEQGVDPLLIMERHRPLHRVLKSVQSPPTRAYRLHFASYLQFIEIYHLDLTPTEHTLALYVIYMCQLVSPSSVEVYLEGIIHYLAPLYPSVSATCSSELIVQALRGCKKLYKAPVVHKRPLLLTEVEAIGKLYLTKTSHDDFLFLSQLLLCFYALLRLGEVVYPDDPTLDSLRKMPQRQLLSVSTSKVSLILPDHDDKPGYTFGDNKILVLSNPTPADPITAVQHYLQSRDHLFPNARDLWIRVDGSRPRRAWFLNRLNQFYGPPTGGHSLRAGGVAALMKNDVSHHDIQKIGRWTPEIFEIYLRQHPLVLPSTS